MRVKWIFGLLVFGGLLLAGLVDSLPAQTAKNLPYRAIEHPEFIPASDATFMNGRDRLIGVSSGRLAKAYPAGILSQHGLVQDKLPDGPIAVTW